MKNCILRGSVRRILILIPCIFMGLLTQPSESADLSTYCQYPPYVYQSKLPSVMLLVSNSYSNVGFCISEQAGRYGTERQRRVHPGASVLRGLFDPDYWYNSSWQKTATKTSSSKPSATSWHGSFLNWLTMRRIDVVNKLLTGGIDVGSNSTGYQSCGNDNTLFKKYLDDVHLFGNQ